MPEIPFELPGLLAGGTPTPDTRPVVPLPEGGLAPVLPVPPAVVQFQVGDWRTGPARELRTISGRSIRLSLLEPGEAKFSLTTVPFKAMDFHAGIYDLWVVRNGTTLGRWRIVGESTDFGTSTVTTNVATKDYRHLLDLRPVGSALTWTGVDRATIGWDIVTAGQAWGSLGLTKDPGPGPGAWVATGVLGTGIAAAAEDSAFKALSTVAALPNGFEPYINPDLTVSLNYPHMGSDKGVVLDYIIRPDGTSVGGAMESLARTVDLSNYANVVRQSGATGVTPVTSSLPDITSRPEGVWVKVLGDTSLTTADMVAGMAATNLATYSEIFPEYNVTLRQGFWRGPSHMWLGDTVTYVITAGDFQVVRQSRIHEISIGWDANNTETVTLALSKNSVDGARALRRALRDLRYLALR